MSDIPSRLNAALQGRYHVERQLGAGGMATVYLARDLRHGREVALKVLHPELSAVIGAERFLGEIRTTAALQHPHILPLFDSGEADGLLFFVLPFVAGDSLRDRLDREKQLPVDETVALVAKVADALDHAHGRGVVHRDIKPANILLSDRGEPLVADFGIALAVSQSGERRVTETGLSLGTPDYMSPEQAAGERDLGPRSDLYALGCVLYELLTGAPPFTGPTPTAVISRIITADPEPPSRHRRSIPPHVDAVVMRALEKLPADRFTSAGEMARALSDPGFRHVHGGVGASPEAPAGGRRWQAAAVVMTVIAGLLAASDLGLLGGSGGGAAPVSTPLRRSSIVMPDGVDLALVGAGPLGVGMRAFDVSPDGDRLVFAGHRGGEVLLHTRDMATGVVTTLEGTEDGYAPFLSPDGEWVGYFAGSGAYKVPFSGGAPIPLAEVDLPYGGAWLPDDRIVMVVGEGMSLISVPAAGGRADTVRASYRRDLVFPEPVPGGGAVLASSQVNEIVRVDLATGQEWLLSRVGWVTAPQADSAGIDPEDLVLGTNPRALGDGRIVFVSPSGTLTAVRQPAAPGDAPGEPEALLDGLRVETVWGAGQWDVSDDGTLFYVEGETARRTWLVWRDTSGQVDTLTAFGRADWGRMDLSPSGRRLVIQACSVRGDCGSRLLGLAEGLSSPAPESDGTWFDDERLVLTGETPSGELYTVLVRADNQAVRDSIPGYEVLDVSRDGSVVASGPEHLVVGRAERFPEGVRETQLPPEPGWGLVLRPGGGWVAYTPLEKEGGEWQVYMARTEPPWDRFRVSPRGGEEPVWHPDGRLVYREGNRWMAVPVPNGADRGGAARILFEGPYVNVLGRSHDVDPDGRHILVEAPGSVTAPTITMVSGWAGPVGRAIR